MPLSLHASTLLWSQRPYRVKYAWRRQQHYVNVEHSFSDRVNDLSGRLHTFTPPAASLSRLGVMFAKSVLWYPMSSQPMSSIMMKNTFGLLVATPAPAPASIPAAPLVVSSRSSAFVRTPCLAVAYNQ